jgi:hypothetical protein
MLLSSTSLLSPVKTKTGQTPRKGVKVVAKKNTKKAQQTAKAQQTTKEVPRKDRPLTEEEKIIQAAETYHKQLSGKNGETVKEKKVEAAPKQLNYTTFSEQSSGADRDLSVNIFTGNPGIYQAEGDTLNYWSFSPVSTDTLSTKITVVEQPGKPYGFVGKPMKAFGQDWTFFLILIGWTVFASLRFGFSKYIVQVFQSIFNFSMASRLYREQGYNNNFGMFRLNLIFYLFLPFSIYLIAKDNGVSLMSFSGIEFYGMVLVAINAYFLVKILLYKILGSIFSQRESTGELVFNMMLYHNVLGLILLPVSTIHSLVPDFGIASLFIVPGLVALFYLMSLIRSIYFAIRVGISIFYLILYLCALEILPILLVVKLATGG